MRSLVLFLYSALSFFAFTLCNPSDLRNPGDTRSQAFRDQLLWQEFIRPRSICDMTSFDYAPAYTSVVVKEALTPVQLLQKTDKSIYVFGVTTFQPEKNLGSFIGTEDTGIYRNAVLYKFNETGSVEWSRTLGTATSAGNSLGIIESDSGVYLAFTASSGIGSPINAFTGSIGNIAVFHIANDGSILWNTYYGDNAGTNKAYSIAKLSNGDLIISGESNSSGIPTFPGTILKLNPSIPQNSAYVMRMKPNGTASWIHFYGGASAGYLRNADRVSVSSNDTITTFGFDREPLYSGYSQVVQNHTGTAPRKEYLVTQFDSNGTYLRHTFILTNNGQASPILPLPKESEIPNEMIVAGVTSAEFQGLEGVRARNYQGSSDQFLIKLNSTLNVSYVTYLGGSNNDQASVYKIFQDTKKEGHFLFSPFLYDPEYGPGFPGSAGYPTLGLVRLDSSGKIVEYGFRAEKEFNVPFTMLNTCDGGMLLSYFLGDSLASPTYAKFRLTKIRPMIPFYHEYRTGYGIISDK